MIFHKGPFTAGDKKAKSKELKKAKPLILLLTRTSEVQSSKMQGKDYGIINKMMSPSGVRCLILHLNLSMAALPPATPPPPSLATYALVQLAIAYCRDDCLSLLLPFFHSCIALGYSLHDNQSDLFKIYIRKYYSPVLSCQWFPILLE